MSYDIYFGSRRRIHTVIGPTRNGGVSSDTRERNATDFLRGHERECSRFDLSVESRRYTLMRDSIDRIADTENLWIAAQRLGSRGRKAPGPNGEVLTDLLRDRPDRVWHELRKLSDMLKAGTYAPGRIRAISIPKSSGKGTREIEIANWQDQAVQRAIVQIIQPLLDPLFDNLSYGFRPGRGRIQALAAAIHHIESVDNPVLICADLKDAFTTVPHQPLLERFWRQVGNHQLTRLVHRVIGANGRKRGIPQGGALSPILLNVYIDGAIDQKWARSTSATPLVRYADDLLVICSGRAEAEETYLTLERLLRPTGMTLKGSMERDIIELVEKPAHWLGYQLQMSACTTAITVPPATLQRIYPRLQRTISKADGCLEIQQAMRSLMAQFGPSNDELHRRDVIRQLKAAAMASGTSELPSDSELLEQWKRSNAQFWAFREHGEIIRRHVLTTPARGSAGAHVKLSQNGAGETPAPTGRTSSPDNCSDCQLTVVLSIHAFENSNAWIFSVFRKQRLLKPWRHRFINQPISQTWMARILSKMVSTVRTEFSTAPERFRLITNGSSLFEFARELQISVPISPSWINGSSTVNQERVELAHRIGDCQLVYVSP